MNSSTVALRGANRARRAVNWLLALGVGAVSGGAPWGVLPGLLFGTPLVDELRPPVKWFVVIAASSVPLVIGGLIAVVATSLRVAVSVSGWSCVQ